ncbi:MAG: zinc metallopeptidase [Clostridia bacterium]|nr:zinc metallopeptidase [Clostridia bacterium]
MPFYYFDAFTIPLIAVMIFVAWAQFKVKSTFSKYAQVATARGMTGAEAAQQILQANGITNVRIEPVAGELTDHYSPSEQVIRLSEPVCHVASVAAVGVAAHEAGHAVQYARGYAPMKLRSVIIPVTQFSSRAAMPLFLLGLVLGFGIFVDIGVALFFFSVLFQLVTLPVEFNASRRALEALRSTGYYSNEELSSARKVLSAAAMTYVGALLTALVQFLRLVAIANRRNR